MTRNETPSSKWDAPCHVEPGMTYRAFIVREALRGRTKAEIARLLGDTYTRVMVKNVLQRSPEYRNAKGLARPAPGETRTTSNSLVEKVEVTADTMTVELPRTRIRTKEELLAYCQVDTREWEVERFLCNKWEMGSKTPTGDVQVTELFQVKCYLKRRVEVSRILAEIEDLKREAKEHAPVYPFFVRALPPTQGLLELTIPDLHMGKHAWAEESGEDYDVNIAETVFQEALAQLLRATSTYDISRVLFVPGNDLLNADNLENTTARGTPQTTDSRQQRTFRRTRKLLISAIDRCLEIADVDVVVVPGNHDRWSMWALGDSLDCRYEHCPQVQVYNSAALRKYYEYGRCMLQLTHGSEEKPVSRLQGLAASEQPAMWGRTRFREAHIGHWHRQGLIEEHGFRIRFLSSLCSAEDWHAQSGYVGNVRSAEAFVWHWEDGLIGHHYYNVPGQVVAEPQAPRLLAPPTPPQHGVVDGPVYAGQRERASLPRR